MHDWTTFVKNYVIIQRRINIFIDFRRRTFLKTIHCFATNCSDSLQLYAHVWLNRFSGFLTIFQHNHPATVANLKAFFLQIDICRSYHCSPKALSEHSVGTYVKFFSRSTHTCYNRRGTTHIHNTFTAFAHVIVNNCSIVYRPPNAKRRTQTLKNWRKKRTENVNKIMV